MWSFEPDYGNRAIRGVRERTAALAAPDDLRLLNVHQISGRVEARGVFAECLRSVFYVPPQTQVVVYKDRCIESVAGS